MGEPDMLYNDYNAVTLMLRDMDLQYEPPDADADADQMCRDNYKLRCLVKEYKKMTENPDVDEKLLMTKFDFIIRFAEDHEINSYERQMGVCHRLMDFKRHTYKSFQFALIMNDNTTPVTKDMLVPIKSLPDVSAVRVELKGIRAKGVIDLQVPMHHRKLYERMRPLFDLSLVRFMVWQHWSLAKYNALLSRCVLL